MPLFGSTPFEEEVVSVTNENNLTEDWALILDVCDKTVNYTEGPKFCLQAIMKRLSHTTPNVVMQTLTLLEACVNNCGKRFHLQVSSRYFSTEIQKLLPKLHPAAAEKFKKLLQKWAENEFKDDPELCLIPSLYYKLKSEGVQFPIETETKEKPPICMDPDAVNSQEEEDDIVKAIELSLKETGKHDFVPCDLTALDMASNTLDDTFAEPLKVRALYDFEAAEDNELTIKAGEIIIILDSSSSDSWWKGANHRGDGLFPSNFVTKDLDAPIEIINEHEEIQPETSKTTAPEAAIIIDENKILMAINWLNEADPTGEIPDADEMIALERNCHAMAPLIEENLQKIDKRLALLNCINKELVDSLTTFYKLTRDSSNFSSYYDSNLPKSSENLPPSDNSTLSSMSDSHFVPQSMSTIGASCSLPPSEKPFTSHLTSGVQSAYRGIFLDSQQESKVLSSGKSVNLSQPKQNAQASNIESVQVISKTPNKNQDCVELKSALETSVSVENSVSKENIAPKAYISQTIPHFVPHNPHGLPPNYIQYQSQIVYPTWLPVTHTPTVNPACIETPDSCSNSGIAVSPHLTSLNGSSVIKHPHSKPISQQEVISSNGISAVTVDHQPINVMDSYVCNLNSFGAVLPIPNNIAKPSEVVIPLPSDS